MLDISVRELKGHNILAVERFQDKTRHMIEFVVRSDNSSYGARDRYLNVAALPSSLIPTTAR